MLGEILKTVEVIVSPTLENLSTKAKEKENNFTIE